MQTDVGAGIDAGIGVDVDAGEEPAPKIDLLATLQRAAESLTPVVVDPGPELPRLATFVDSVVAADAGGAPGLILRPIGLDALLTAACGDVVIRSCDPGEPWFVTARRIVPAGARAARVDLRGAAIAPHRSRTLGRTDLRGREPVVLGVPSGTEDLDGCVFPVHGLSATHVAVEATFPLEPGRTFDPVELIGNRRILRRAAATVVEVIPWIEHDGSRRFRCRLLLSPSAASGDEQAYDLLSQGARIQRLLELGCMLTTSGFYRAPGWPCRRMRLLSLERDRLIVALDEPPPDSIPLPVHIQVGFELFSVSYEMQVWPLRRRGATLELTLPLVLRRRRRRREQRAAVAASDPITVGFRNPVTGGQERRRVADLSFGGLSFEAEPATDVLWPGIVLEDVAIEARGQVITGSEIEVRSIEHGAGGRTLCHAANRYASRVDDWPLVNLLGALQHPDVETHDGSDFHGVMGLYRRAGLLAEFIDRNLTPVLDRAAASWHRLHESSAAIARTFVARAAGQPGGALQAAVSAVRAWDRTWLAQHFASDGAGSGQITGALHLAYLDFVLPREDAHYLAFFVKSDNAPMNAFYARFSALAGTPEAVDKVGLDYWIHRAGSAPRASAASPYQRRPLSDGDEPVVARAAERTLGRLAAGSLAFHPGQIALADTDGRFQRANLRRFRDGQVVTRDGRVVIGVLTEQTSPGINLTWMLNASWILPVHADCDDGRATALALEGVLGAPPPVPGGDRFVITVPGVSDEPLLAAGFEKIATVYLYVFNRSGLHRYQQYVADRYGEVGAVVTRRRGERQARLSA